MFQTAYQEASAVTSTQGSALELDELQEFEPKGASGRTRDVCGAQDDRHGGRCGGTEHAAASSAGAVPEAPPPAAAAAAARWRCVAAAEATHIVQRLRRQLRSDRERRSEREDVEDAQPSEQLSAAARACGHVVAAFCHASACRTLCCPSGPGDGAFVSQRVAEMASLATLKCLEDDRLLALARSSPLPTDLAEEPPSGSLQDLLARARALGAENEKQRARERERMCGRLDVCVEYGDRHDVR